MDRISDASSVSTAKRCSVQQLIASLKQDNPFD